MPGKDSPFTDSIRRVTKRLMKPSRASNRTHIPAMHATTMLSVLAFVLGSVTTPSAYAQPIECGVEDAYCLQRYMEVACREEGATRNACEAWLHRLEGHPNSSELEWRLAAGWVYMSLADFATVSVLDDYGSVSADEAAEFRSKASAIFNDAVVVAPDHTDALSSLALVTEDPQARIKLKKRVVALDPADKFAVLSLANELAEAGDAAGYREAAEVYETAYSQATEVAQKLMFAHSALYMYEMGGEQKKAAAFRGRLSAAIKFNDAEEEFSSLGDPNKRLQFAHTICNSNTIMIFDREPCLRLIELGQAELLANGQHPLQEAEGVVSLIAEANKLLGGGSDPDIVERFRSGIRQLISAGYTSATIYDTYADFLTGAEQQDALEKAVAFDPHAGTIRYRLGVLYLNQEMVEQAITQLEASRVDLPESWLWLLDMQLKKAQEKLNRDR